MEWVGHVALISVIFLHQQIKVNLGGWAGQREFASLPQAAPKGATEPKRWAQDISHFFSEWQCCLTFMKLARKISVTLLKAVKPVQTFTKCHPLWLQPPVPCEESRQVSVPSDWWLVVQYDSK